MEHIIDDFRRYNLGGRLFLIGISLIASVMVAVSLQAVVTSGFLALFMWVLLALIMAATSAQHPIYFFGNKTGLSVSEGLIFLAVIALGPYHGALLGGIDMALASSRLRLSKTMIILNTCNQIIAVFVAGQVYYLVYGALAAQPAASAIAHELLLYTLPLISLALSDYALQAINMALISHCTRNGHKVMERLRNTWPWEPMTYLASAIAAALINYTFNGHGVLVAAAVIVLVLPFPVIIYYTFKTYRDKISEQERHHKEVTDIYDSILEMLAMAIDAKDDVTHDHIQRVRLFARRVGELVGLSEMEIEALKAGALLHDIGKIGVPSYILNKPGRLTEHEFEQMKMHTIIGADMLSNIAFRYPVVPIVRHHHERWDGRGYPDGLKGTEIPITARILTLVDNYDALRSDRPYKKGMTREEALAYIKQNAGTFFDPGLVELFLSVIDRLEEEAAALKAENEAAKAEKAPAVKTAGGKALASARPAAGFAATPEVDRARAALHSIAETNQRVTGLYEMSRTLSSLLPIDDTLAILANRLSKLIPFTTCAIAMFDPTRSEFEIAHAVGAHADKFHRRRMPAEAGITGWVITNQRAMYNTNPVLDLGFLGAETAEQYKGVMVYPLVKNQEAIGALAVYSTELETYGAEHIQLMESISQAASDAVYNARTFEQAQRDALTDPVSGLANLRAFSVQFEHERARSQRHGTPLSLLVVNLNQVEEALRARNGSEHVLKAVGKLIRQQVRETDLVARHSGGTLLAMLPDSGPTESLDVCSRIREALQRDFGGSPLRFSLGAATGPADGEDFETLYQSAQMDCLASHENLAELSSLFKEGLTIRQH